jgi:hypothetical protein
MSAELASDVAALEFDALEFDEIIEDMLRDDWSQVDAQDAVELAEIVYAVNLARQAEGRPRVALPLTVERQVLECAKRGMYKGQGRHRPRDSYLKTRLKEAIAGLGIDRQQELNEQGMKNPEAQDKAAEEARAYVYDRHRLNLAANTIKRMMQTRSD